MFEIRNPKYAIKNVRNLYSVRKAMKVHRKSNPQCEWCGRTRKVHVHHIAPVATHSELAGESANLMTLCAKRCHLTIGHFGNWKTINPMSVETCLMGKLK